MLIYDLKNGFIRRKLWVLLPVIFWFIALCNVYVYVDFHDDLTWGSCLFIILSGNEPVDISQKTFTVPIMWLLIQLGYVFFTIEYPTRDMNIFGQQIMIRLNNKNKWILSKCLWMIGSVLIYWGIGYLMICIFCVINSIPLSITISGELPPSVLASCDIYVKRYSALYTVIPLVITPILTSISICHIQMLAAMIANEIIALSFSISIIVWSMCVKTPLAIGNYAIMERSSLFNSKGLSFGRGIILLLMILFAAIIINLLLFKQKDILEPKKNGE